MKGLTSEVGMPIDRKTKQLVFYECEVETVKRVTLKAGETFTREGANQVFERGYRKRQARAVLFCLTDRMRFEKRNTVGSSPFRKQLTYREIKHFFVFPSSPNVFMLCVVDEVSKKKIYEMFRCRPEDVNTICDLTFKASTDPQNLLRDLSPLRQLSVSSKDYGTDQSGMEYNNSRESSPENMKHREISHSLPDYVSRRTSNIKIDQGKQNGHISDSPPFDNDSSLVRQHSVTPPRLKTTHFYPPERESKIKGVFSCYELVEPTKRRSQAVSSLYIDEGSPTYGIREWHPAKVPNGVEKPTTSVQPISQHKYGPIQQSHETLETPDFDTRNQRFIPVVPRRYSPLHSVKPRSRIVIEREPIVNPPVRKSVSTNNLTLGDDVTYVSYNPIKGNNISDYGPMYMYITRYESARDLTMLDDDRFHGIPQKRYSPAENDYLDWYR
ncbi:hypothetical protein FBUS_07007 [Fasciolopsis buskii]|uniref:Trematode PH-like domain-containing protein n=1 Tax=Fasciolopsis buskii TaxID=27845 RepID=A0A8E0VIX9_9TREM|nr:hypothetical protein FBUS_07007 [Fasciolopsis buski]